MLRLFQPSQDTYETKRVLLTDKLRLQQVAISTFMETYPKVVNESESNAITKELQDIYPLSKMEQWMTDENFICLGLYAQKQAEPQLVGFCTVLLNPQKDAAELKTLYILKAHQNQGWGRRLVERSIEALGERSLSKTLPLTLKVWDENTDAIAFYKKMGFEPTGRKIKYPSDHLGKDYWDDEYQKCLTFQVQNEPLSSVCCLQN